MYESYDEYLARYTQSFPDILPDFYINNNLLYVEESKELRIATTTFSASCTPTGGMAPQQCWLAIQLHHYFGFNFIHTLHDHRLWSSCSI